ncbi:LPXTG cell wall anchor domain-containing protein [Limosilactobacillus sp. c10Ua_36]|nr:LPXTG cell wall anchor domain-containing protein [Limosilactobacillus sp. c10Ua_36]
MKSYILKSVLTTGATTSQSNGAKVSATGLNGKNAVRINANKQAAQLPQTGNQTNTNLGAVGLAAASLAGLFGFTKLGKKKED